MATKTETIKKLMGGVNGATFIAISTKTEVKLLGGQKNPHKGRVFKHTVGSNVMVFTNKNSNGYDNMVKKRLAQEGKDPNNFELSPRTWGERIPGTCFVEHNGELYLEVIFLKPGKTHYELDGQVVGTDEIIGFNPRDEEKAEQGGLDNKVVIRAPKFSSITSITIDKEVHTFA